MNPCIVNYITSNSWHPHGQNRLRESLSRVNFKNTLFFNETNLKCPTHADVPYAFKLYALKQAQLKGFDVILWVDASFWAIREVDSLFDLIKQHGVYTQECGHTVGTWCSDSVLQYFNLDREEAFNINMFSGGCIGYNLKDEKTKKFFDSFYDEAVKGTGFIGPWKNTNNEISNDTRVLGHRHDMVVGSILAKNMGIEIQPNNTMFSYLKWYEDYSKKQDLSHIYFVCEGGKRKI